MLSETLLNDLSTVTLWHQGNGMDARWLAGISEGFYTLPGHTDNFLQWECGSSRVKLKQVSDIADKVLEIQRANKNKERSLDTFTCNLPPVGSKMKT